MLAVDVIVRTRNRAALLPGAVAAFLAADRSGLEARLLVVDNGSTDGTAAVLADLVRRHGDCLVPLSEPRPGGQHALNRAIAMSQAPVLACFDDDERIDPCWLQVIAREFADPETDYIAGPVRPLGDTPMPEWLPAGFGGVLGVTDNGPERRRFAPGFPAMLTQGNCAVRREVFEAAGPYPHALPTAEDRWLDQWLAAHGRRGFYCPDFVVGHIMLPERMTRAYFRRWARREGRDRAVCERLAGGSPRFRHAWYWRHLAICAARWIRPRAGPAERFRAELELRVELSYAAAMLGRGRRAVTSGFAGEAA